MTAREDVEVQLVDELGARVYNMAVLDGPDAAIEAPERVEWIAGKVAGPLCSDDDNEAAQTVIDLMCALWPDGCEPPAEWWRTPVGRMVARSIGRDDAEAVTHSVAAAMLGVARGTVSTLVHRGTLDRHPDGGVLRSSVMARLARLA